jgi:hypothetical protein
MAADNKAEKPTGGGIVTVGPVDFMVRELSAAAELRLLGLFCKNAKDAWGPGGFYANAQPMLKWMKDQGEHEDRAAMLETIGRMQAKGESASAEAGYAYRLTPDGVADEMFYRTRETHRETTLKDFRALVNDVNAFEVHEAIIGAVSPKD